MANTGNQPLVGVSLGDGSQVSSDSVLGLLEEARIASFEPTGLNGVVRITELCNENFQIDISSDYLLSLAGELQNLANKAKCEDANLADIRPLMEAMVTNNGEGPLTSYLAHAHHIQVALLSVADRNQYDVKWVKDRISRLALDDTLDLISSLDVPEYYRSAINEDLKGIPGYNPVDIRGKSRPVQDQEVYRHYSYFASLIHRTAENL